MGENFKQSGVTHEVNVECRFVDASLDPDSSTAIFSYFTVLELVTLDDLKNVA